MSERENRWVIEQIYAAFGRGDLSFILNTLADGLGNQIMASVKKKSSTRMLGHP
jgi:hypothetical protein